MALRTPIKQARGLGSAHHGTGHWMAQRITAVALVPLLLWLAFGIASYAGADYAAARAWIGSPVTAIALVVTLAVSSYHGVLGLQVVLEDYVPARAPRLVANIVVQFAAVVLAAAGIFAVLKIALGG